MAGYVQDTLDGTVLLPRAGRAELAAALGLLARSPASNDAELLMLR
jgi:hypothetical protein